MSVLLHGPVREATHDDFPAVLRMAQRFLSADGPYGTRFTLSADHVGALLDRARMPGHILLVAVDADLVVGMLAAFTFEHPITGEHVASELCWWMEPEYRGGRQALHLLHAVENWAKDQGAQSLEMIAPNEHVAEFYGRVGYERTDVHYRKTL